MNSSQSPPNKKYFLPSPKKIAKSYNIDYRSLSDITIVDETKGQNKETCSHHIVNSLVV